MTFSRDWYMSRMQPLFAPDGEGGGNGEGGDDDPLKGLDEKTQAAIKARVDSAAAAARKDSEKRARDLERDLEAIKNSGKSESEKLAARLEALEKDNKAKGDAIRERDAKDAARTAAKTAGAPDGDLIYRVIKSDIEFDDDGKPTNLKTLIDDLKQLSPNLFKVEAKRINGGDGNGQKPKVSESMNSFIRASAGRE